MKPLNALRRIPLAVVIVIIGVVGFVALMTLKPRPEPHPETEPPKPVVNTVVVTLEDRALSVETQGTVEPRRQIQLVSQVAGQIVETAPGFADGGRFAQGDWLVRLDPRDYRHALARADAQLRDAERVLAEERGRARQAEREWRDLNNEAANDLFLRRPQIASAEASLAAARAERDQRQLDLERAEIRAPFDGRIRQTLADLGQYVAPGTAVAELYDDAVAQVRLPLTDDQSALLDLPLGQAIAPDAQPKVVFTGHTLGEAYAWVGRLVRTEASLDPQSRVLHAIAEIPEPFNAKRHPAPLLMGTFVSAEIEGRSLQRIAALPLTAVFQRDHLYALDDEQQVVEKRVRVLKVDGDRIWVRGDLRDGERVIIDRQGYVSPGVAVALATDAEEAPAAESGADAPAEPASREEADDLEAAP